jgi:hypothetical protein
MKDTLRWEVLKEAPERLVGERRLAMEYLLRHADRVEMAYCAGGKSKYRAYLDDGAFKGEFVFTWKQDELLPLRLYLDLASTNWPGFSLAWLSEHAAKRMQSELSKEAA